MMAKAKGDGSVYKRADGRWVAALDLGLDAEGKRRRATRICRTKPEATQQLRNLRIDRDSGKLSASHTRDTVAEYLEAWLSDVVKTRRAYNTWRVYSIMYGSHIKDKLGDVKLAELDDAAIQRFVNEVEREVSPQTARVAFNVLRTALSAAHKRHLIAANPCAFVELPAPRKRPLSVWNRKQAEAFLQSVRGDRLEAYFAVAIALGLRKGEALALRWSDVDLEAGTLSVRHTLIRVKGEGLKLSPTKTHQSERTLYIPAPILPRLKEHRRRQLAERMAAPVWAENDLVFMTKRGMPIEPSAINKHFAVLCRRAGLPVMRVHDMRHLAASLMAAQGVDLKTVSTILGHANINITADVYMSVFDEAKKDVASKMGNLFKQAE